MEKNALVQLAVDIYRGKVSGNYSIAESNEVLTKALCDLNKGHTEFQSIKAIREAKKNGLFEIIEEMITKSRNTGLPASNILLQFAETHNLTDGDSKVFEIRDGAVVVVSKVADGTNQLKRQRFSGGESITVETDLYGVKIYEELRRLMTNRTDWVAFVDAISKAFIQKINDVIYAAVIKSFDDIITPYKQIGTFDEVKLQLIIDHVEADNPGKIAVIIGSTQAVRKIKGITGIDSDSAKEQLFALGYVGRVGRNPVIAMDNAHAIDDENAFVLGNDLYIVASDEKFIKFVDEGDTLVTDTPPENNKDFTHDLSTYQRFGVACVMTRKAGIYKLS